MNIAFDYLKWIAWLLKSISDIHTVSLDVTGNFNGGLFMCLYLFISSKINYLFKSKKNISTYACKLNITVLEFEVLADNFLFCP